MSTFRLVKDFRPQGHAYFEDGRGRYYVADCSGKTPTDTDDGPLLLDFDSSYIVERVAIPVKGGYTICAAGEEAEWFINFFATGRP